MTDEFLATIQQLVHKIPSGKVSTYGQIATLAGYPRHARHVGKALAQLNDPSLPWHRVVNAQGKISHRGAHGAIELQQILLEDEGVEFGLGGVIPLKKFLWQPE